jgi:N4-(beta-N-acetylglucosaminyl)-L-asparaginase
MNYNQSRRSFLASGGIAAIGTAGLIHSASAKEHRPIIRNLASEPIVISSGNGIRAVDRARELLIDGADTAVAVVNGVGIVEADPDDMSVGFGGLPNEDGVVQLDASVMHGPTHKAGSVGALEDTLHAAQVALKVLQTTDHVMIVGDGARRFARAHGFPEMDMLTDQARQALYP